MGFAVDWHRMRELSQMKLSVTVMLDSLRKNKFPLDPIILYFCEMLRSRRSLTRWALEPRAPIILKLAHPPSGLKEDNAHENHDAHRN